MLGYPLYLNRLLVERPLDGFVKRLPDCRWLSSNTHPEPETLNPRNPVPLPGSPGPTEASGFMGPFKRGRMDYIRYTGFRV